MTTNSQRNLMASGRFMMASRMKISLNNPNPLSVKSTKRGINLNAMNQILSSFAAVFLLGLSSASAQTSIYSGSGTGFGQVIGTGASLSISNNVAGNLDFTLTRGAGLFSDTLVLYIDSVAGGFANTLSFNDQADPLRSGISGASGGSTGVDANARSTLTFNTGFTANYALALNNGFAGLWQLATGGDNSLTFVKAANLTPTPAVDNATNYNFNFNVADIGLTANSGQSFKFVGTYLNAGNSFRSNESIGFTIAGANPGAGGIGSYPNTIATSDATFTTIPEPSSASLIGLGLAGLFALRRYQKT